MSALPPLETAFVDTSRLEEGLPSFNSVPQAGKKPWQLSFNPKFIKAGLTGTALFLLPVAFIVWAQPHPPQLQAAQESSTAEYIAAQRQNNNVAQASPTQEPQAAELASASEKSLQYYLTLGQGFLNKAIDLSRQTSGNQTEATKQEILTYLEKALENTNKAIDLDSRQGASFLLRARIYKTASVIKPELAQMSDQDLQIARALGVDDDLLNQDAMDLLPTQQATNTLANGPIVADAEEGNDDTVTTETEDNALSGQVTLQPGSDEVYVPFSRLTTDMQLTAKLAKGTPNPDGLTFSIQSRDEGKGFTIKSSEVTQENLTIDWQATELVE